MRKFNITVNGNTYKVDVEEVGGVQTAAPVATPVAPAAPAPAPAAAPAPKAAPAPAPASNCAAGATKVTAPMPGTIVSIKVNVGDKVESGTLVAVLEAMKMENEIFAGSDGVIASVNANAGDAVNTGDVLVTLN